MEWNEDGLVLAARQHGESSAIITLLTLEHGRHAGMVRGGGSSRARGIYQPGNLVSAVWRGRLIEHLGNFHCELLRGYAGPLLEDAFRLAILGAVCAIAETALPEREPHPDVFSRALALLALLNEGERTAPQAACIAAYVRWELTLLRELGYGLDLSSCAVTGESADLTFVSPKSGRAVSTAAAGPWKDRLLALPAFLLTEEGAAEADMADARQGLALTGWFLDRYVYSPQNHRVPAARLRLVEAF
jgi:DNA repair protein RecO (recombination protein O)